MPTNDEPKKEFFCYNGAEYYDGVHWGHLSCILQNEHAHDVCEYRYGVYALSVANQDPNGSRPTLHVNTPYVDLTDLRTGEWIGVADGFEKAWGYAAGYLRGLGSKDDFDHHVLALHKATGNFQIYCAGAMIERGEDYELWKLEKARVQAEAEARVAAEAVAAYRKAQGIE